MPATKITCDQRFRRTTRYEIPTSPSPTRVNTLSTAFIGLLIILLAIMMPVAAEAFSLGEFINKGIEKGQQVFDDTVDKVIPPSEEEQVAPAPTPQPASDSKPTYTKVQVRNTQNYLTELGYKPGPVDGVFGAATEEAIRAYQADYSLPRTGEPTDQLLAHMKDTLYKQAAGLGPKPPAQTGTGQTAQKVPQQSGGMVLQAPGGAPISAAPLHNAESTAQPSMSSTGEWPQSGSGSHNHAATAKDLGLKVIRGMPVIAGEEHYVLSKEQIAAAYKFTALIELGLDPDLLESNPACFARAFLPTDTWDDFLVTGSEAHSTSGYIIYKPMVVGKGELINLKGTNEFEKKRTREAFLSAHGDNLKSKAISLPTEVLIINEMVLRQYDGQAGGFDIGFKGLNTGETRIDALLSASGVQFPRGTCTPYGKDHFLEFSPAVVLPEIWSMEPSRAEKVLDRLVERRIFVAYTLRFREIPLMKMDHNYLKLNQASKRIPVWSELTSVAVYEDAGLERLIDTVPIKKAEEPVLLSGVPESPRFPDTLAIDGATLALVMLRDHGDVLSEDAWHDLMVHQASLDKDYYIRRRERFTGGGSIFTETTADFDRHHTPFFPNGFTTSGGFKFSAEQIARFKEWAKLRAMHLPGELILRTTVENYPSVKLNLPTVKVEKYVTTDFNQALIDKGYSTSQVVLPENIKMSSNDRFNTGLLEGPEKTRSPALVLPNIASQYIPSFSDGDLQQIFEGSGRGIQLAEISLKPGMSELVSIKGGKEIFALHVTPTRLRTYNRDSTAVLFEHHYDFTEIDPNRLDAAVPGISPPVGEALPLTAETMDLLTVKYLPDYVSDEDYRQMMLARWEYEASIPPQKGDPNWGRFFIPGKPKPDAAQQAELVGRFKSWTVKRASALPQKLRLASRQVRIEEGKPVPIFSFGIYHVGMDPRDVNGLIGRCTSEQHSHPALAPACDYLGNIRDTTPAIYPFGLGDKLAGPRMTCGSALGTGQRDVYCDARLDQFDKVRPSGVEPGFRDILVYNKEIFFPGSRSDALSLKSPGMIVDVAVTGARVTKAPLPMPFMEALKRYETFREGLGLSKSGYRGGNEQTLVADYLIFDADVLSASLVEPKSQKPLKTLELRPARTPDLDALALKDPSMEAPDEPFGPEILGIRLGMTFDEAEQAIRIHMKVGRVLVRDRAREPGADTGKFDKFSSNRIYVANDESELIILYDEPPAASNVVIGITRQMHFDKGQMTEASAIAQMRGEYGKEDWNRVDPYSNVKASIFGWGKGLKVKTQNDSTGHQCLPSFGSQSSRHWVEADGSQTHWRPPTGHNIPSISMYNNPIGRNCGAILSMQFEPIVNSQRAKDPLVIQLVDPNRYFSLYEESKHLVKSGEAVLGDTSNVQEIKF